MEKLKQIKQEWENHKLYIDTFSDAKTKEEYAIVADVDAQEIITIKGDEVVVEKMDTNQKDEVTKRVENEKKAEAEIKERELREKFDAEKAKEEKLKKDQEFEEWKLTQDETVLN